MSSGEDIYSNSQDHFLTGEEGSSSSFGAGQANNMDSGNEPDTDQTWVQWYCSQRGNEMLCEVEAAFLTDESNLQGLKPWEAEEYNFDVEEQDPETSIDTEKMIFENALSIIENQSELEDLQLDQETK